jgi:hypothetical protein
MARDDREVAQVRVEAEQRLHTEGLELLGRFYRTSEGRKILQRIPPLAETTVLVLESDRLVDVMRRIRTYHPEPVNLAVYYPETETIEVALIGAGPAQTAPPGMSIDPIAFPATDKTTIGMLLSAGRTLESLSLGQMHTSALRARDLVHQ